MQLNINGYRGIDRAEIVIPEFEITLLAGKNAEGKTSIIEALRYNVMAIPNPLDLDKKDIKHAIHAGADKCQFSLETEAGKRTVYLPECEVKNSRGTGLHASDIALGVVQMGALNQEGLANALNKYLEIETDSKRLAQELDEIEVKKGEQSVGLSPEVKQTLLDTVFGTKKISARGWDAGEKCAKEKALVGKTQFKMDAGVTWGSSQGLTFTPKGWEPDLEKQTEEVLSGAVVCAREALERAIAENAVSESQHEEWKSLAGNVDSFNSLIETWTENVKRDAEFVERAADRVQAAAIQQVTCRKCSAHGTIIGGYLEPSDAKPVSEDEKVEYLRALSLARGTLNESKEVLAKSKSDLKICSEAAAKLKDAKVSDGSAVQDARMALSRAESRMQAFRVKAKGVAAHLEISCLLKAAEILGPEGLRRRVLLSKLEDFNKQLAQLCTSAGWSVVTINRDLKVMYGDKPYVVLSASEKYRVNATLQLVIAKHDKAEIVVFDAADILDRDGRNQLIRLLVTLRCTSVVGMTISVAKDGSREVADLSKIKNKIGGRYGVTYWVENASVSELAPLAVA